MRPEFAKLATFALQDEVPAANAKQYLLNETEDSPAAALYAAVRTLYGIGILLWEPESIWLTLEKDGIDLSIASRNKIMTAITLQVNPSFYWDSLVFAPTIQALNDVVFNADMLQECNPAHMSWGVYEASILRGMDPDEPGVPEFDEDVQVYVAICLKKAGFVCPPEDLSFAEDALAIHAVPSPDMRKQVKEAWSNLNKEGLQEHTFPEDPLGVQLARLAGCYVYRTDRAKLLAEALLDLR